jgi:hypothetical protein
MSMLDSVEGRGLLAVLTSQHSNLQIVFQYNDRKTKAKLQSIMSGNYNVQITDDKGYGISANVVKKLEDDGYKGRGRKSNRGTVAQLSKDQKEVFDLLKKDKISVDDPRMAILERFIG